MKMRMLCTVLLFALPSAPVFADTFSTYGDVSIVTPGPGGQPAAYQILADPSGLGYGGLQVQYTSVITPDTLTTLSASYQWVAGTFGGGDPQAPRFTLYDASFNQVFLYWGTNGSTIADPNAGAYGSTGNLADGLGSNLYVISDGFGGVTNTTPETWATFLTLAGSDAISFISLDIDGPNGFSAATNTGLQEADVTGFTINNTTYTTPSPTPEPSSLLLLGTGVFSAAGMLFRRSIPA